VGAVLLAGSFGNGNPAEEALLTAFNAALPGVTLQATTRFPAGTRALHGCVPVPASNPVAVLRAAWNADATVLCGRNVFGDPPPLGRRFPSGRLAASLALLLAARARARPRAIVGATVDPLRTPVARGLARGLVRWSDLLVLRDDESAEALAATGATAPFRIGADPAWTLVAPNWEATAGNGGTSARKRDRIVIALGPPVAGAHALERLAAALGRVQGRGLELVLQPWQTRAPGLGDGPLARFLADRLDPAVVIRKPPVDLRALRDSLTGSGLVVGLRYHALIAAAAAGVPSLTLEDRPEMVGLARRLGQPVASAGLGPDQLAEAILRAIDHPPPTEAAIATQVSAAEDGFRLLRLLTSGGKSADAEKVTGLRLDPEPRA
jgi:polysaccharide pyruvyl transferase WcaK-like protein